jgi:hypothetical protein
VSQFTCRVTCPEHRCGLKFRIPDFLDCSTHKFRPSQSFMRTPKLGSIDFFDRMKIHRRLIVKVDLPHYQPLSISSHAPLQLGRLTIERVCQRDNDSQRNHRVERNADCCVVSTILALEYENPLNTWARRDDSTDLSARLAAGYQLSSQGGAINKYDSMYERSTGQRTSIAVHARSDVLSSTASENIPSLTRGNSIASSAGSADTDLASALDGIRALESVDGVLQVPVTANPHADLYCPLHILDCEESFNDVKLWKTHIFSHFRGLACPVTANCFLCERIFTQTEYDHPARAWNEMLSHVAAIHFRGLGEGLATVRTDFGLMRWMWNRRLITPAQFRRTQMIPMPTIMPETGGAVVQMPEAPMAPPTATSPPGADSQADAVTVQASSRRERRTRQGRR